MRDLKAVITELRKKHGNKSQVARKLGISPQRLGQYERGKMEPKIDFFEKWKEVFDEDIRAIQKGSQTERNVSHETENPTHVDKTSDSTEKPLGGDPARIYEELYEKFLGSGSEYFVIHKDILKEHRLVAVEQLEKEKHQAENAQKEIAERMRQIDKLTDLIGVAASRPINIQLPNPEKT